jgi:hypothetical protein
MSVTGDEPRGKMERRVLPPIGRRSTMKKSWLLFLLAGAACGGEDSLEEHDIDTTKQALPEHWCPGSWDSDPAGTVCVDWFYARGCEVPLYPTDPLSPPELGFCEGSKSYSPNTIPSVPCNTCITRYRTVTKDIIVTNRVGVCKLGNGSYDINYY